MNKFDIDDYLTKHHIEDSIDEIVNKIVIFKPNDPNKTIAEYFLSKSSCKIISVEISPVLLSTGNYGIEVTIETNLSVFSSKVAYPIEQSPTSQVDLSTAKTVINDFATSINLNETSLKKFDDMLSKLSDIDTVISLAMSMCYCRVLSYHKGIPLYVFLAQENDIPTEKLKLPVPICSVLVRVDNVGIQNITITPIKSASFKLSVDTLVKFNKQMEMSSKLPPSSGYSLSRVGSRFVALNYLEDVLKSVSSIIQDVSLVNDLKIGLELLNMNPTVDSATNLYNYQIDSKSKSSTEMVDYLLSLWKECEIIAFENPIHSSETELLKSFKSKLLQLASETTKKNKKSPIAQYYCLNGIGGETSCNIQIMSSSSEISASRLQELIEAKTKTSVVVEMKPATPVKKGKNAQPIVPLTDDLMYNTIKVRLGSFSTISEVIEYVKLVKQLNWVVITSIDEGREFLDESFLSDFTVGIGANMINIGGLNDSAYGICKLNRLLKMQRENEYLNNQYPASNFRL